MYRARINPVVNFPGQGVVLFGDKTALSKPSAFDRINVRRLFLLLEKAIATAAKFQLFEFNDEFTRAQFRNLVEPFLRDIQGRRGITDFSVKVDDTNNTGEVIDRNEFIADIFIKPARSINFITLNFIAVRTGVSFYRGRRLIMGNIDDFKANLIGGGARPNQFRITITPPLVAIGLDVRRTSFLITAIAIPSIEMNFFEVPFRGRVLQYPGDRPAFNDWTTTFYNDTDFMIKTAMERWSNGINDFALNTGTSNPADYQADLIVEQLDRDDTILKTYILRNCFPTTIGEITLETANQDAIETFDVTWKYQHLEASGVNF